MTIADNAVTVRIGTALPGIGRNKQTDRPIDNKTFHNFFDEVPDILLYANVYKSI